MADVCDKGLMINKNYSQVIFRYILAFTPLESYIDLANIRTWLDV